MADQSLTDFSQAVKELAKAQRETNDTLKTVGQTVGKEVVSAGQSLISPFTSALSQIPGFSQFTNITKILGKQLVSKVKERNDKNLLAKQLGLSKAEFKSLERQKKIQDAQAKHIGTMESAAQSLLGMSKEEVKKRRLERTGGGKEKEQKIKKERKEKKQQDVLMEIAKNTKKTVETEQESSKLDAVKEALQTHYLRKIAGDTKKHTKLTEKSIQQGSSRLDTIREIVQTNALLTIALHSKKHTKLTEKFIQQQHKDLMVVKEASEPNKESKKGFLGMIGLAAIFTRLGPMLAAILPIIKVLGVLAVGIPLAVMLGIGAVFGAKKLFGLLPSIFDFILDYGGPLGMPSLREIGDWFSNLFAPPVDADRRDYRTALRGSMTEDTAVMLEERDKMIGGRITAKRVLADYEAKEAFKSDIATPYSEIELMHIAALPKTQIERHAAVFSKRRAADIKKKRGQFIAKRVLEDRKAAEAFKSDIAKPYSDIELTHIGIGLTAAQEERKRERGKMTGDVAAMLEDRDKLFGGKLTAERVLRDFKAAEAFKSDIAKPYSTEALMQIGTLKAAREAVTLKNKTDKEEDAFTFRMKEKIKMGHELSMGERLEMRYIQERKEAEAALQRLETARQGGTGAGMGETNVAIDASTQSERDVLLPTSFAANLHRRKEYFLEAGNLATA